MRTEAERAIALAPKHAPYYDDAARLYEAAGDYAGAADKVRRLIDLSDPNGRGTDDQRALAARLYRAAGDAEAARAFYMSPRVTAVQRSCAPPGGTPRPACLTVAFAGDGTLSADPAAANSVANPGNYLLDGRPLPAGTRITYDPATHSAFIDLPAGSAVPTVGTALLVRDIADTRRALLDPNPTSLALPP